jgi:quinol monooxygenase YgiN
MAGIVHIPWYATVLRGDRLSRALHDIAPVALRYGAFDYELRRSRDDSYRFVQSATFEDSAHFYAYWEGEEFIDFRTRYMGWFQVPVLYEWFERVTHGQLRTEHEALAHAEAEGTTGDIT